MNNCQETRKKTDNNRNTLNTQRGTIKLAKMGMLVGIAVCLVTFIHFPIFPTAPFLEYDPADIPIIIGTFAFGPIAGILLVVVTSVIQGLTVSATSGIYGILMHIIATGAFVLVAGMIYRGEKNRKKGIIAILAGIIAMTGIMVPANLFITPLFMGVPRDVIWGMMPVIIGFNCIKAGINGVITFILYKRISKFLHR